jgi:signal transduction histidine kinase
VLYEFLIANRDEILVRSRAKLSGRKVPTPTPAELADGLPLFVEQLIAILRAAKGDRGAGYRDMAASAALHGGELLRLGLTVAQVVHDYGSICQSVTELADERDVAIAADDFQTLNRCLDDAIAEAVTTYEEQRDRTTGGSGPAQLGFLAHEMRNLLSTSMLTFDALSRGNVGVHGSTGTLLGRSLRRMRTLIDRTLAEVRLEGGTQHSERVSIPELIEETEVVATIDLNEHDIQLSVDAGRPDVTVVANLVQNAFKFTRAHGHIKVRSHTTGSRVLIDVEDECGGLPPGKAEDLFRPFEQRSANKTGLGLGLSVS